VQTIFSGKAGREALCQDDVRRSDGAAAAAGHGGGDGGGNAG
jgi:hypothetical protein